MKSDDENIFFQSYTYLKGISVQNTHLQTQTVFIFVFLKSYSHKIGIFSYDIKSKKHLEM